jgi:hypothetical protein
MDTFNQQRWSMLNNFESGSLSLEGFNHLDHYFGGLIPEIEIRNSGADGGSFIWVCSYAGMNFYRRMTIGEAINVTFEDKAKSN